MKQIKISMIAVIAIVMGITASAFNSSKEEIRSENLASHYFRFNGGNPLSSSSYTELTGPNAAAQYDALGCSEGETVCGIIASDNLPGTMVDNNNDGLPDATGVITTVDTKE